MLRLFNVNRSFVSFILIISVCLESCTGSNNLALEPSDSAQATAKCIKDNDQDIIYDTEMSLLSVKKEADTPAIKVIENISSIVNHKKDNTISHGENWLAKTQEHKHLLALPLLYTFTRVKTSRISRINTSINTSSLSLATTTQNPFLLRNSRLITKALYPNNIAIISKRYTGKSTGDIKKSTVNVTKILKEKSPQENSQPYQFFSGKHNFSRFSEKIYPIILIGTPVLTQAAIYKGLEKIWLFEKKEIAEDSKAIVTQVSAPCTYEEILCALQANDPFYTQSIDLSRFILTKEHFEELKKAIDKNFVVGYIYWGTIPADCQKLKQQIEDKLVKNICDYAYHPSDYVHGLLSMHIYNEDGDLKEGQSVDFNTLAKKLEHQLPTNINTAWRVIKVYHNNDDSDIHAALYVNEEKHQVVLAFCGTKLKSIFSKQPDLCENINGILGNSITNRKQSAYVATEDAVNYVKKRGFNLSITGHSLGGYLAELAVVFCCHSPLDYKEVKGVVFDSPGSNRILEDIKPYSKNLINKLDIRSLPIIAYLSVPNMINSCDGHPGEMYMIYSSSEPQYWEKDWVKRIGEYSTVGDLIKNISKGILSTKGHKLNIMLRLFDPATGKPKEYVHMKEWPTLDLNSMRYIPGGTIGSILGRILLVDKINYPGKNSAIVTLSSGIIGAHIGAYIWTNYTGTPGSIVSFFAEVPNIILGQGQFWTTIVNLPDKVDEKYPIEPEKKFKLIYGGHWHPSLKDVSFHPLNLKYKHRNNDWYLYKIDEKRKKKLDPLLAKLDHLPTMDITLKVLNSLIQDYKIDRDHEANDEYNNGVIYLKIEETSPASIETIRNKIRRARNVLPPNSIEDLIGI